MQKIRFLEPLDGDVLITGADGNEREGMLLTSVKVASDARCLRVSGIPAEKCEGDFTCLVPVRPGRNTLTAEADGETAAVRVVWWKGAEKKYRFTVDDCTRCFEELATHDYTSIFDAPFLRLFRDAHDRYGSMVHINCFYESVDGAFDLSMMPERYRDEFTANADWLSLTFHARCEFPDAPYRNASFEEVTADCNRALAEIRRFAGEKVLRDTTTLHWGAANADGVRALRQAGYRALCGYLCFDGKGEPLVSYYLNKEQTAHAEKREAWMDFDMDVLFVKLDFVLNDDSWTADVVARKLDELSLRPHEGQFIQMVIHEQYFYPDYSHYEPDYAERVMNMAAWMAEHGYTAASLTELTKGI